MIQKNWKELIKPNKLAITQGDDPKRVATLLLEFPGLGSPRSRGRRGFSMSLFPYTVIYRPEPEGVFILVVKHDSRRPGVGGSRR